MQNFNLYIDIFTGCLLFIIVITALLKFFNKNRRYEVEYNKGIEAYQEKNFDMAVNFFLKAIRINSEKLDAFYNLGLCQMEEGSIDEAIENFNKALKIKISSENANYYLALAQAYDKRFNLSGNFEDLNMARDFYGKTLEIDPKNEEAWYNLAICSAKQGLWEDCVNFCQKVIEINNQSFQSYNQMGLAMYCKGDYDKAVFMYKKAISINVKYSEIYTNLGYVLEKQGNFQEAVKMFRKFLELEPNAEGADIIDAHIKELENVIKIKNKNLS